MKDLEYYGHEKELLISYDEFIMLKGLYIDRNNGKIYIISLNGNYITTQTIILSNNFTLLRYLIDNIYIGDFCVNVLIKLDYDIKIIKYILNSDKSYITFENINFYNMYDVLNTNVYEIIYYIVKNNYFDIKYEHIKYAKKNVTKK